MHLSSSQIDVTNQNDGLHLYGGTLAYCFGSRVGDKHRGFTLVELIMVLVIVGILAIAVAPRFFSVNVFNSRGFSDQVQATLRYAQKIAIAQRRFVCVAFTTNSITLTVNTTATCPGGNLAALSGSATTSLTSNPTSITFASLPSGFYFDALGRPSTGQTIFVNGATNNIVVEAETGYVHSP